MKAGLLVLGLLFIAVSLILMLVGLIMFFTRKKVPVQSSGVAMQPPYQPYPQADANAVQGSYAPPQVEPYTAPPPPPPPPPPDYQQQAATYTPPAAPVTGDFRMPDKTVAVPLSQESYGALIGLTGELSGRRFEIDSGGFYIGRDRTVSQLIVEDGRISKRHAWVGVREGKVTLIDNGSTNGTYLNAPKSQRITETVLNPGDVIILADDAARFEYRK